MNWTNCLMRITVFWIVYGMWMPVYSMDKVCINLLRSVGSLSWYFVFECKLIAVFSIKVSIEIKQSFVMKNILRSLIFPSSEEIHNYVCIVKKCDTFYGSRISLKAFTASCQNILKPRKLACCHHSSLLL